MRCKQATQKNPQWGIYISKCGFKLKVVGIKQQGKPANLKLESCARIKKCW